jgi:hypothetical protein
LVERYHKQQAVARSNILVKLVYRNGNTFAGAQLAPCIEGNPSHFVAWTFRWCGGRCILCALKPLRELKYP